MIRTLSLSLSVLLLASCASDHEPWLTRGLNAPEPEQRDVFTLERTACYGVCPVYTVKVDERDILEFRGVRHVAEQGGAVGSRLPEGSFAKLKEIARAYSFNGFDKAYPDDGAANCPQVATDSPTVIVSFETEKGTRAVSMYQGCTGAEDRTRFNAMVAEMEKLLDIDDMVGERDAFTGAEE